jgi:hypothetical protein
MNHHATVIPIPKLIHDCALQEHVTSKGDGKQQLDSTSDEDELLRSYSFCKTMERVRRIRDIVIWRCTATADTIGVQA